MYIILEYTNEKYIVHAYRDKKELSIDYIKKKLLESKKSDKIVTIDEFDYTTNYIEIYDKLKIIYYKYNIIEIDRIKKDECKEILKNISEENKIEENNIKIKDLIKYFVKSEYEIKNLEKEFEFDEKVDIDIEKYIIDYLIYDNNINNKIELKKNILSDYFNIIFIDDSINNINDFVNNFINNYVN